jgi:hypothetical protein
MKMVFTEESPMSLALTTTHENGIFGGVSLPLLRPYRTFRTPLEPFDSISVIF